MAAETTVRSDLVARARRDVERSLRRTKNGLKLLSGVGRPSFGQTPRVTVWSYGKIELWRYASDRRTISTPLLIVHSLVSRSYVFDLAPGNSFVEFMLDRGFDVFLVNWGEPDEEEAGYTLETYCDEQLPNIVDAIRSISGSPTVTVFGYCFGGLLSLLYAAGHPDDPVSALAVMATPVRFSEMGAMTSILRRIEPEDLLDQTGNVPAEVIRSSFKLVTPTADLTSYANLWQNLWNEEFVASFQVMTQWANDHIPFAGACFSQVARLLGRDDLLSSGRLPLGGRIVDLHDITAPFLSIIGTNDQFVPPAATGDLTALVGSKDAQELRLRAGHVGLIAGRSAHQRNLPLMADWLEQHSEDR